MSVEVKCAGRDSQSRRAMDGLSGLRHRLDLAAWSSGQRCASWEDQRSQYWTRLLFCALALMYFSFGGEAQVRPWVSLTTVTLVFTAYGLELVFFMWHAWRQPHAPWRQRLTMWVDLAAATFAVLADSTLSSPGFLVYLMVILGNGMRYGLRLFGEAVIGTLGAAVIIVWLRLFDYVSIFSVSAIFFLVFFAIIVLYSYSLTVKIERARAKLAHERNMDPLTGMLNRRALMERASQLFQSPDIHGGEIVVLFADLDGFKGVNDTHGHDVGDRVLMAVARRILDNVRDVDLVARYGGDEFLLILPRTSRQGGDVVAQRVRQAINDWSRESGIDFNVSIGVGNFPDHGADLESVIASVDKAMYRSKLLHGGGGILHVDGAGHLADALP